MISGNERKARPARNVELTAGKLVMKPISKVSTEIEPEQPVPSEGVLNLVDYVDRADFPTCLMRRAVRFRDINGKIVNVSADGSHFTIRDSEKGEDRKFKTSIVQQNHSSAKS